MDLSLIKEIYDEGLFVIADEFNDWKDAIRYAATPLIEKKYIDSEYVDGIYRNVEKNGMYIFIAPHICIPHCGEYEHVHKNCLGFMKCNKAVIGEESEPDMAAELFFTLAAKDEGKHLDVVSRLANMLEDENVINALLNINNIDELKSLFKNNGF